MIKVAVVGALGKMGRATVMAVSRDPELDLTWAVDVAGGQGAMLPVDGGEIEVVESIQALEADPPEVIVDFTQASAAVENVGWALRKGVHCVVGTTGIGEKDLERIKALADETKANVIIAPNFALGAVLMMRFSEMAARVFDQCEIIELHHRAKLDSPSGTALETAARIEANIEGEGPPPSREDSVRGTRGGEVGPVHIHSVRLDGLVAHQEVIFGSTGQTLTIRHDTTDRSCFMPGVIMAVKAVHRLGGLTLGLDDVLGV